MVHAEIVKERREGILRIAAQYGAQNVRLFGSVARGEADAASDIDFLVEMEQAVLSLTWADCRWNWRPSWDALWMWSPRRASRREFVVKLSSRRSDFEKPRRTSG